MSEPRFFPRPAGLTAGEIAQLTGATAAPGADLHRRIFGVAALDEAGPDDLAFLDSAKLAAELERTRAGICLVSPRFRDGAPPALCLLVSEAPFKAFVAIAQRLFPAALRPSSLFASTEFARGAFIHPTARLESGVTVDPGAVIGAGAEIGSGTVVGAGAVIGPQVRIGRDCAIGPGVTLTHALVGDRVTLHPGARIGQDGFGYVMGAQGHDKVPQVGRVIVQNEVEIGANTTIDRGGLKDTTIGEGTKIDNLVQIGHNCSIGRHCVIVSQTGISGSVQVGDYVAFGGKAGIADHLTIGEGAKIGASSGLMHDVPAGEQWLGAPAKPAREFFREVAALRGLASKGRRAHASAGGSEEQGSAERGEPA